MSEPFGHLDPEFFEVDVPWPLERVLELAEEIMAIFAAAVAQPGPDFTVTLTPEHVQFIGKAMVVQLAVMKMWRAHLEGNDA